MSQLAQQIINPQYIKKREYQGLGALLLGTLLAVCGLASLFFLMPLGLVLFGMGAAALTAGIYILNQIPDVLCQMDEAFL